MSAAMPLSQLLAGFAKVPAARDVLIRGLTANSHAVQPGDAFVAVQGLRSHGLNFADQARHAGASAILFEPPLTDAHQAAIDDRDSQPVADLRTQLGQLADRFHAAPSAAMNVIGVTGTNGKTSTVQLLAQALHGNGKACGTIGTLGSGLYPTLQTGERTTPDVLAVHALLAGLRDQGAAFVAMEVSSHALDQGRVDGVRFEIAVFSNLSRDHLDYHGDMERYGAAKARLFQRPELRTAVVNVDDAFGRDLLKSLPDTVRRIAVSAQGDACASLRAADVQLHGNGLSFDLHQGDAKAGVQSPLLGRFNVDNLLAVAGCLLALDWPLAQIADALSALTSVPGRMSRFGGGAQPLVVVDYAHTPDALEQSLRSLRAHVAGRLLCLFGCGGDRDRGKRPLMAAVAEAAADAVIVSDDNPRHEDGDAIIADIMAGFRQPDAVRVQRDREAAIRQMIAQAQAGDVLLVAGKGHEAYQEIGDQRRPFDDSAIACSALEVWA